MSYSLDDGEEKEAFVKGFSLVCERPALAIANFIWGRAWHFAYTEENHL